MNSLKLICSTSNIIEQTTMMKTYYACLLEEVIPLEELDNYQVIFPNDNITILLMYYEPQEFKLNKNPENISDFKPRCEKLLEQLKLYHYDLYITRTNWNKLVNEEFVYPMDIDMWMENVNLLQDYYTNLLNYFNNKQEVISSKIEQSKPKQTKEEYLQYQSEYYLSKKDELKQKRRERYKNNEKSKLIQFENDLKTGKIIVETEKLDNYTLDQLKIYCKVSETKVQRCNRSNKTKLIEDIRNFTKIIQQ